MTTKLGTDIRRYVFLAYVMNEDSEIYNFITNENNYLGFANEIIYYTGLNTVLALK